MNTYLHTKLGEKHDALLKGMEEHGCYFTHAVERPMGHFETYFFDIRGGVDNQEKAREFFNTYMYENSPAYITHRLIIGA